MYQQIIKIYPFYKDSWIIVNSKIAEKHIDRSSFIYGQTGIPKDIAYFFHADDLKPGEKIKVYLSFKGKLYEGEITMDINERIKLSWWKELRNEINSKLEFCSKYFIDDNCATDEIQDRPFIRFIRIREDTYKIEFIIR